MSAMEEAIQEFTTECDEMLERISLSLSSLEKKGPDKETLSSIYRDMHTIKGSSQLFGFSQIGNISHAMESSLDPLRQGVTTLNLNLIDVIYRGCDVIGRLVNSIKEEQSEHDASADLTEIIPKLIDLTITSLGSKSRFLRDDFIGFDIKVSTGASPAPVKEAPSKPKVAPAQPKVESKQVDDEPLVKEVPTATAAPKPAPTKTASEDNPTKASPPKSDDAFAPKAEAKPVTAKVESKPMVNKTPESKPKPASAPSASSAKPKEKQVDSSGQETIRVQVSLLDKLMNLAGELVLVRNQVLRFAGEQKDSEFSKLSQRINLVTTEIQNEVMKTRMQPVGSVLSKFHRVVRDLAKELEKKIELKLEGTETELDKTLIEAVKDPLTHIVRNSADHGLEGPAERVESGKPELGTITIRSYHEGGQVVIEISDNGRGLSRDRISQKAIEKNIITTEQAKAMSDKEVYQLIFAPGFSTAATVSNISGRGVGMDVVKTNIERIGGIIDLNSEPGNGTTIFLKIPLTLAIVPALLVREGNSRFAIPQVKLLELLRIDQDEESRENKIEILQGKPVYRLRGQLLPLVSLSEITGRDTSPTDYKSLRTCNIVVLKAGTAVFGLIVDDIEDSADIVVKPLTSFLKALGIYAGATLLGDGTVALTLDVMGIAEKAQINLGEDEVDFSTVSKESQEDLDSQTDYLVVDVGDHSKYSFPLPIVNRLEEFKKDQYNYSGSQKVVRYRGSLLPIISVPDFFQFDQSQEWSDSDTDPIVVIQRYNRLFGLQVGAILDVITSQSKIDDQINASPGIMGSIIDKEDVLVVIDAMRLIDQYCDKLNINLKPSRGTVSESDPGETHILVVEDSRFFRNHITKVLENAGFKVSSAENGELALDALAESSNYQVIVSDIEMPKMDGFGLAKQVKSDPQLQNIPMIAVTTRFRQADIDRGMSLGFFKYLEKLNEDQLLTSINEIIDQRKGS